MSKSEPENKELYESSKKQFWKMYEKPSAYRSAMLVRLYKEAAGTYSGNPDINSGISRWFRENWRSDKGATNYPFKHSVHRPTVRMTKDTPATSN